jgi:hypothetical protein
MTTIDNEQDLDLDDVPVHGHATRIGNTAPGAQDLGQAMTAILQDEGVRTSFKEEDIVDYGLAYKKVRSTQEQEEAQRDAAREPNSQDVQEEIVAEHREDVPDTDQLDDLTPFGSVPDPDETTSVRSSPSVSSTPARVSLNRSATGSPSPRPFDRRFHARMSSSASTIPRIGSSAGPSFLRSDSRRISMLSNFSIDTQGSGDRQEDQEQAPWEVVKWSKLKKITSQAFSEAGKRTFGRPTFLTVGALIAIGTSKGLVLLFDFQQTLKSIIGQGTAGE